MSIKVKRMKMFNHHCGNCHWRDKKDCMIPVERFKTFEGIEIEPLARYCPNAIATKNCHWKRAKND